MLYAHWNDPVDMDYLVMRERDELTEERSYFSRSEGIKAEMEELTLSKRKATFFAVRRQSGAVVLVGRGQWPLMAP